MTLADAAGTKLERLHADHAPAVLAFELANRDYFAASISDRGDDFFDQFTDRHRAMLAEQEDGLGAYYVLVAEDASVLGRFNLFFTEDGSANLGYRVAQHVAGRGVTTATVRELCLLAAERHGLRTLRAATSSSPETTWFMTRASTGDTLSKISRAAPLSALPAMKWPNGAARKRSR